MIIRMIIIIRDENKNLSAWVQPLKVRHTVMRKTKLLCKMWELCGVSSAQQRELQTLLDCLASHKHWPDRDWQTRIVLLIIECYERYHNTKRSANHGTVTNY